MRQRAPRRFRPLWDILDDRCLLYGYTPAQITAAYGLNALTFLSSAGTKVTGDGSGQTIALVEVAHDPNVQASLNTFDSTYGLPATTIQQINLAGNQTDDGWAGEESMDVEWAHAIAPGAKIVVVEANPGTNQSNAFTDLMTAIQTAGSTPGVSVVSMSLGGGEFSGESAQDSVFTTKGVVYVASSGDDGTVQWPAASPYVLAVGGTSLQVSSSGSYQREHGWVGTGGGLSSGEPEPTFQQSVQSTNTRSTPDVSFDADPSTGVAAYFIPPKSTNGVGEWGTIGGTSVGAPAWAGILAIINQGRVLAGQSVLTGATQTLPALYGLPATDFHKVSLTSGGGGGTTNQAINTANYNTQTGLGSPIGALLVNDLVDGTIAPTPPPPPPPPAPPPPPTGLPPAPQPPPFTLPTPSPTQPIHNPLPPITAAPSPPKTPTSTAPIPPTPPPAAPPKAVATPKAKKKVVKKKHKPPHRVVHTKPKAKHAATGKTKTPPGHRS
jgi:hypothetical protein